MRRAAATGALLAAALICPAVAWGQTSCVACHGNPDWFDEEDLAIVRSYEGDVHAEVGLSCHDCHGGNPSPELAEDVDAMDPGFEANPYIGAPERPAIPGFCGRCHSDPNTMRRFRPDIRVDQEREYWTSQHGQALAGGDTKVATCIDCHGAHGILRAGDPASQVYPTRVAGMCASCHADVERMAGYTLPDGRALPVDQHSRWQRSVHAAALLEKEDLSAPTCNDCHGNHGAAPPGLESIAYVCGQCHGREAQLFRASAKHADLELHNEFLAEAGGEGCAACHSPPESAGRILTARQLSECAACHGNHAVVRPTVAMFDPLPEIPCAFCHEGSGLGAPDPLEPEASRRRYAETLNALLAEAETGGLEAEERFDWLVEQSQNLPVHTVGGEGQEGERPTLRPEFERLFNKFRIGKTHFTYEDPAGGGEVREAVTRCSDCHWEEEGAGLAASRFFLDGTRELTTRAAHAERLLLVARRGGVETRQAAVAIDHAVDAQIELQVLVHTFAAGEGGAFADKQAEGLAHAGEALAAAHLALDELAFRRKGLGVALIVILLVLIGLALKIRTPS